MISKWKVANFKSIQDETELDLGPLTILAGANSSGKSSFIQSMLLLSQSIAANENTCSISLNGKLCGLGQLDEVINNINHTKNILISVTFHSDHGFNLFYSNSDSGFIFDMGFGSLNKLFDPDSFMFFDTSEINYEISFGDTIESTEDNIRQLKPRILSLSLCVRLKKEELGGQIPYFKLKASLATELEYEIFKRISSRSVERCELYKINLETNKNDKLPDTTLRQYFCTFTDALPNNVFCHIYAKTNSSSRERRNINGIFNVFKEIDRIHLRSQQLKIYKNFFSKIIIDTVSSICSNVNGVEILKTIKYDELYGSEYIGGLDLLKTFLSYDKDILKNIANKIKTFDVEQFIDRILVQKPENSFPILGAEYGTLDTHPISSLDNDQIINFIKKHFTRSFKYLGPLRDPPKPYYPIVSVPDISDIGITGEFTVPIFDLHKNSKVKYIPSSCFKNPQIDVNEIECKLIDAVADWLNYLDVANIVDTENHGKYGQDFRIKLSVTETPQPLIHVGVGVSQIFPIVVMCLIAKRDATLVFEQPELHLHPKVQSLLGDFFLSIALCDKQCIIETHSEYLIDKIRFRIAASEDEKIKNLLKLYFVEKSNASSVFRNVDVNEYGAILDWPDGFFDQSQKIAEDILNAAVLKRQKKREEASK
jgi:predicted ATPase